MSGGVVLYAAQSNVQIDAEIAAHLIMREFGRFRTKTNHRPSESSLMRDGFKTKENYHV